MSEEKTAEKEQVPAVKGDNTPAVKKDAPPAVKQSNPPVLRSGNPPAKRVRRGTPEEKAAISSKPARAGKKPEDKAEAPKGGARGGRRPSERSRKQSSEPEQKLVDAGPAPSLGDMLGEEMKKKLAERLKK